MYEAIEVIGIIAAFGCGITLLIPCAVITALTGD